MPIGFAAQPKAGSVIKNLGGVFLMQASQEKAVVQPPPVGSGGFSTEVAA